MASPATRKARHLRLNATEAEKLLWRRLRELKHATVHFRQQAPIGPYIADFASHKLRLVIEVDGGQHGLPGQANHDHELTQWLISQGYRVLRFWNNEVLENIEGVMAEIVVAIDAPPTPDPSPPGGGESLAASITQPSPLMGEGLGGGDSSRGGENG